MSFTGENNWKLRIINGNCAGKILSEPFYAIARFSRRKDYIRTYIILGWQSYETILSFRSIATLDDRLIVRRTRDVRVIVDITFHFTTSRLIGPTFLLLSEYRGDKERNSAGKLYDGFSNL